MTIALVPNGIGDFGLDPVGGHGYGAECIGDVGLDHLGGHGFSTEWHPGFWPG